MDTDRNLLFGVLAFQKGAIDADLLAETCATITGEATVSVADRLVDRGWLTVDQKVELERTLDAELTAHGGDPEATLAGRWTAAAWRRCARQGGSIPRSTPS